MELVREILFWSERGGDASTAPQVERVKLAYHVKIMIDGGLVLGTAELHRTVGPRGGWEAGIIQVKGLTWKGHEFLEAMRNDTTWSRTKETFAKHGVPFVTEILVSMVKATISQHTGLALP